MSSIQLHSTPTPSTNHLQVVFSGFNELEQLEDDSTIELLHLNCSNRMLAHLPYLIALDHVKKAVVLAIRCGEFCEMGVVLACFGHLLGPTCVHSRSHGLSIGASHVPTLH